MRVLHFVITVTYMRNHKDTKTQRKPASMAEFIVSEAEAEITVLLLARITVSRLNC
jgi:hypothetical protein